MKNLKYFVDLELLSGEAGQGDKQEARMFKASKVKLIDENNPDIVITFGETKFALTSELKKPTFCMSIHNIYEKIDNFSFPYFKSTMQFDEKIIKDFRKEEKLYALIISDYNEFIKRLSTSLIAKGIGFNCGIVEYRDTEKIYTNEAGFELNTPYHKELKFSYQKEFRIQLDTAIEDNYILDIGNLDDISTIIEGESLVTGLIIEGEVGTPELIEEKSVAFKD